MTALIHAATPTDIAAKSRQDALAWLRHVAADPSSSRQECVSACEVRLAIHYGKRPSAGAVAWLLEQCEASDLVTRAEARNVARVVRVRS